VEESLVFESDKDSNSILRFKLSCDVVGISLGLAESSVGASPTRVLVSCPVLLTKLPPKRSVDVRAVVAMSLDVVGVKVVLKDVMTKKKIRAATTHST